MKDETISKVISHQSNVVLLRAIGTSRIFATVDGERFENLTDSTCGRLDKEKATGVFTIPLTLNAFHQQNENLIKLVTQLGLAIEI